jgi:hypothetical protein
MGMIVRVDEARQDQMPAPVELFDRGIGDRREGCCDAGDRVAGDGDVGGVRLMPVPGKAASDGRRG